MAKKSDIKKIDYLAKKYNLSYDQRTVLHDHYMERLKVGKDMSLKEIEEIIREIKKMYPNK